MIRSLFVLFFFFLAQASFGAYILIPMDTDQKDHLKAYGITYWVLDNGETAWWLLNYRGGSFAFKHNAIFEKECLTRGVSFNVIPNGEFAKIRSQINNPEVNEAAVRLEVAPKIAVYSPDVNARGLSVQPWDDAVTMVLTYAEIPYEVIYDDDVLLGKLAEYDWLHLHHEDFTGQYGRFYASYHSFPWYKEHVRRLEEIAHRNNFQKVSQLKLAVVKEIKDYVGGGGFMFAMCSATDTYDIALAAEGIDICDQMYDGDPPDPNAEKKLDYSKTFAFKEFDLVKNPLQYEYSSIDNTQKRGLDASVDYFKLFDFSAKWDPVPSMLTQNHTNTVKGFMGQTTAFKTNHIKSDVLILGETKPALEARYIHGTHGNGTWTFYGGHDPEDYRHLVNDPPTDLNLHPNSPGYRLILNNILFPAAEKKKRKT